MVILDQGMRIMQACEGVEQPCGSVPGLRESQRAISVMHALETEN